MAIGGNLTLRDQLGWKFFGRVFNPGVRATGLFEGEDRAYRSTEGGGTSTASKSPITAETALQVAAVFAAVRVISQAVAQVDKQVVSREFDDKYNRFTHKPLPNDSLYQVLCERPNQWQTPFEFYETTVLLAVLCGNSYSFVNSPTGTVRELIPLMNDQVEVIVSADHSVKYRLNVSGGEPLLLKQEQVFHLKGPGLGGALGMDVLNTVREVIGLSQSMEEVHAEAMRRRGRTDGIVSADGDLDQKAVDRIHANFVERFGPSGDGGVAFLDRGAKFSSMTQSLKDMEMVEHRRHLVDEVGRAFGVYSQLLNQHSSNSAYASIEQVFLAHLTNTVEPWLVRLEQAAKRDIIGHNGVQKKKHLSCDRESLVPATLKDKAEYLTSLQMHGDFTPNEVRGKLKMNPLNEPGADRPMTQLNMRIGYEQTEVEQTVKPAVQEVAPVEEPTRD